MYVCFFRIGSLAENRNCINIVQGMRVPLNFNVKSKRQTVVSKFEAALLSSKEREKSANTHDEIIISKRQQQQKFKTTAAFRDFSVFPSKFEFLANYKKNRDTSTV